MPEARTTGRGAGLRILGRLLLGHFARFRDARLQDAATRLLRQDPAQDQPWVITVVNTSLAARQALAYALYLRPRTALSKLGFRLRGAARGPVTPPVRPSLLCPTRGRPRRASTFLASVARTAADPGRVEIHFYVDDDDPYLPDYRRLVTQAPDRFPRLGRCVLQVGPPVGVPSAWNALAAEAAGDLLMMANDDQVYVDYGWDARLAGEASRLGAVEPDGIYCLYFDAGQYGEGADFPIVSRQWYEVLGYFTPTIFQQWEVERWIFDLARRIGRLHPIPGVFVEHRHYQDFKAPFDATYQLHRLTREKSLSDHALFLRTAADREREAAKLSEAMTAHHRPDLPGDDRWFLRYLEEHHAKIREEADRVLGPEPVSLFRRGQRQAQGCDLFPVTAGVVSAIPEATTFGPGEVWIARLPPGRPLVPDAGPAAGERRVHRVQLCVRLPADAGTPSDGGREVRWAEGRCVLLDPVRPMVTTGSGDWVILNLDVAEAE